MPDSQTVTIAGNVAQASDSRMAGSALFLRRSGLPAGQSFCAFRLSGHLYALDVRYIGSVVVIQDVTSVPLTPNGIIGICSLRGAPLTLVDLALVMELPMTRMASISDFPCRVMILQSGGNLQFGVPVELVTSILPANRVSIRSNTGVSQHPVSLGTLESREGQGAPATLLDGPQIFQRIERLGTPA